MFSFVFCKRLNDVRNLLVQLIDSIEGKDEEKFIAELEEDRSNGQSFFSFNLNQSQIIFIEQEKYQAASLKSQDQSNCDPILIPVRKSIRDWAGVLKTVEARIYYQFQDKNGKEINVIEVSDGTRLHFVYSPEKNSNKLFLIQFLFDFSKFVPGENIIPDVVAEICDNSEIGIDKKEIEPAIEKDVILTSTPVEISEQTVPPPNPPVKPFEEWNPTYGRIIPTLHPYLLHKGQYRLITANAPKPIPFSNEFFEGYALLLVNSKGTQMTPRYTKRFANGNKTCFEIQIQGRFTKVPNGPLFIGAEITKRMELGMFTKGISRSLIQFCQTFSPSLHSSFGDKQNIELPHIAAPFWSTVDTLVITKKNEKPPSLFHPLLETETARKERTTSRRFKVDVNTEDTYSFAVSSANLDLEKWNLIGISFLKPMDLHSFWGDADVRFMAYAIDPTKTQLNSDGFPVLHKQSDLQKMYSVSFEHFSNHPEWSNSPNQDYEKIGAKICMDDDLEEEKEEENKSQRKEQKQSSAPIIPSPAPPIKIDMQETKDQNHVDAFEEEENLEEEAVNSDDEGKEEAEELPEAKNIPKQIEQEEEDGDFDEFEEALSSRMALVDDNNADLPVPRASKATATSGGKSNTEMKQNEDDDDDDDDDFADAQNGFEPKNSFFQEILQDIEQKKTDLDNLYGRGSLIGLQQNTLIKATSFFDPKSTLVVAALELDDHRSGTLRQTSRRRMFYAFRRIVLQEDPATSKLRLHLCNETTLRSFNEWKQIFSVIKLSNDMKPTNYSKLIEHEQRRIQLDHSYRSVLSTISNGLTNKKDSEKNYLLKTLISFLSDTTYNDNFLNQNEQSRSSASSVSSLLKGTTGNNKLESQICLRISNYSYSQECISFNEKTQEIVFHNSSKRFGRKFTISINSILWTKVYSSTKLSTTSTSSMASRNTTTSHVKSIYKKYLPIHIPNSYVVAISTFAKNYLFIFHENDPIFPLWLTKLEKPMIKTSISSSSLSSDESKNYLMFNSDELIDDTNHMWSEKNDRMILNHRHYTQFLSYKLIFSNSNKLKNPLLRYLNDPVKYVALLLEMILKIISIIQGTTNTTTTTSSNIEINEMPSSSNDNSADLDQLWIDFMDGISYLQWLNISSLLHNHSTSREEEEKGEKEGNNEKKLLCLFLNLYHCLLLHGFLIIGIPDSLMKWSSFFRNCCYEIFGEVISLSELEHNILRANMTVPDINFILKSFLPNSKFPFHLHIQDYRLLFVINCGAINNLPFIPIYEVNKLESQLETITRLTLERQVKVINENTVMVPQICQWYMKDFEIDYVTGKSIPTGSSGSLTPKQFIGVLASHVTGELDSQLSKVLEKKTVTVKYSSFEYTCQFLSKA